MRAEKEQPPRVDGTSEVGEGGAVGPGRSGRLLELPVPSGHACALIDSERVAENRSINQPGSGGTQLRQIILLS
jgi:hypothetical protein